MPRSPRLAGYRRLLVCGVVLVAACALAVVNVLASADLAQVLVAIIAGFAAPDAAEKFAAVLRRPAAGLDEFALEPKED